MIYSLFECSDILCYVTDYHMTNSAGLYMSDCTKINDTQHIFLLMTNLFARKTNHRCQVNNISTFPDSFPTQLPFSLIAQKN